MATIAAIDSGSSTAGESAGAGGGVDSPSVSISTSQRTPPTRMTSPTAPQRLLTLPAKGEVISTVALSDLREAVSEPPRGK